MARDLLFAARGWRPCIVQEAEWKQLSTTAEQQDLLSSKLQELGCILGSEQEQLD